MCKRANRHMSERIRYWRMDIRAGTLRSPIERDGPLLRPLRAGRGALHAHTRARATTCGPSPTKPRAKRVRHGRLRQPTPASTHRPSKRFAAFSAAVGRAEPPRRRSRAGRHHHSPGHQAAVLDCWDGLLWAGLLRRKHGRNCCGGQPRVRGSRLGAIEGRASGVPRRRNAQLERVEEEAKSPDACRRTKSRPCPSWRRSRRAVEGLPAEDEISARMHALSPPILACGQEIHSSWREGRARTLRMAPTRRCRYWQLQTCALVRR